MALTLTASADAAPTVKLAVSLSPERLGSGTTIAFAFKITNPNGGVPPPLTGIDLLYPSSIGLIASGLGLEDCAPATLETSGPEGCPADSLMGFGSALVEIPVEEEAIQETGNITTWMAPLENGHIKLLFYADAGTPLSYQFVLPALLNEATPPYGASLETRIPIIPTWPEGPEAAVVEMHATIGPKNITYYQRLHGKTFAYHPIGLRLPETCPHTGFPFAATFTFPGTSASAQSVVPCPHQHTRPSHRPRRQRSTRRYHTTARPT